MFEEALGHAGGIALACLAIEGAAIMQRLVDDTVAYSADASSRL